MIIDKDNYADYVDIPDYIMQKVNDGIITLTHFSDIIRVSLLSKYGGIYLDATIFMIKPLIEPFDYPFYANKLPYDARFDIFVSKTNWSAFFLAGCSNNPIFNNLKNLFFEYWKTHNVMIDYFLIDYGIKMQYDALPEIKELIDNVPENNFNLHNMFDNLFLPYDENKWKTLQDRTNIFKLSYKYDKELENKENTLFQHITKNKELKTQLKED